MPSSHSQEGYPIPVEEQTALDEPIKVRWNRDMESRARFRHSLTASFEDASEREPLIGAGRRTLDRQKSQIVINTVEEAVSVIYECGEYIHPYGIDAPGGRVDVYERVRSEVITDLEQQGWFIEIQEVGRPHVEKTEVRQ